MFFLVFVLFLDCFFNMHLCAKLQPYRSFNFLNFRYKNNKTQKLNNIKTTKISQSDVLIPITFVYLWHSNEQENHDSTIKSNGSRPVHDYGKLTKQ